MWKNLEFPILLDSEGKVGTEYMVQYIPYTIMIDKSGRIAEMNAGTISYEQMESLLNMVEK